MQIVHNGTCTMYSNVISDVQIAKASGYDAIEIIGSKLYRFLDQGYSIDDLKKELDGFPVAGVGFVPDIERNDAEGYKDLLRETRKMCESAQKLGCNSVQLLTGPLDMDGASDAYKKIISLPISGLIKSTAKNLKAIADIGADYHIKFYLEPLNWCPINSLPHLLELINETERGNVGMVIDFWHMWDTGATAEDFAKIPKELIYGVHICDSLEKHNQRGTFESCGRRVWTGGGNVPLKSWLDAIRSTGFDGWYSGELFSPKHWELNPHETAKRLREFIEFLLI